MRNQNPLWLQWLVVLGVACVAFAAPASAQRPVFGASPAPTVSTSDLANEIERAEANQPYGVSLRLSRPATVGEVRTVASQLGIPRVLAHVEYAHVGGGPRGALALGLGEMYASEPVRRYWECRALLGVGYTDNALRHLPIDEWPVSELHVFATAHAIRELMSGRLLPPTTVIGGGAARPQDRQLLEQVVRNETTQVIEKPPNIDLPADCSRFVGFLEAPVLSRDFPRGFRQPEALDGEDFREFAFRVLGQLPRDTAVTIDLKLAPPGNLDLLTSLVREYDIKGMRADLLPVQSPQRLSVDAELSTYGGALSSQVDRVECQLRLAQLRYGTSNEWYTDWINISLSIENAALFLSYANIAQARVTGAHPTAELDRLRSYFESRATRVYEMPKPIEIPSGCEYMYVHNDQDEVGEIRSAPPE